MSKLTPMSTAECLTFLEKERAAMRRMGLGECINLLGLDLVHATQLIDGLTANGVKDGPMLKRALEKRDLSLYLIEVCRLIERNRSEFERIVSRDRSWPWNGDGDG
jgi:hypothetical protein